MKEFQKGLTLIELMAVIVMIVIVTSIVFGNYGVGNQSMALERAGNKLYQDLRLALNTSMAGSATYTGVGVYFDESNEEQYIIFKDLGTSSSPGDNAYNGSSEDLYVINIEKGVTICDLKTMSGSSASTLYVNFKSPYPSVFLNGQTNYYQSVTACGYNPCVISIVLCNDSGRTRTVTVNNAGKIEISN
jgi:prepilin-type N-terminal cleavage/methylation domain-containing protein